MDAVGADDADQDGADDAEPEATVLEGVGHRQDAGAQATLEQVQQGPCVSVKDQVSCQLFITLCGFRGLYSALFLKTQVLRFYCGFADEQRTI